VAQTRRDLAEARLKAARIVDDARNANAEAQARLAALGHSGSRRRVLAARRALVVATRPVRHPIETLNAALAACWSGIGAHRLAALVERALFLQTPMPYQSATFRQTDQPDREQAVRWLGPLEVSGVSRPSVFVHPRSSIGWTVFVEAGTGMAVDCAVVPAVAQRVPHGVIFDLAVAAEDGSWSVTSSRRLHPRLRWTDRYWRRLRLSLPAAAAGPVTVRVTTHLAKPGVGDYAWAVVADTRLRRRRPWSVVLRMGWQAVRQYGLSGALRRWRAPAADGTRAEYRDWIERHMPGPDARRIRDRETAELPHQPLVSVITPVYNTEPRWLRACVESVRAQRYARWELLLVDDASTSAATSTLLDEYATADPRIHVIRLETNGHISAASNAGLDRATGDFVALLDHDDELAPDALGAVVHYVNAHPDVDFVYTDEDKIDQTGERCDPYFKPDWSPEHFMNFMYTNHLMVLRRAVVEQVGRFRLGLEGSQVPAGEVLPRRPAPRHPRRAP
jgi:hypothetical protein